MKHLSLTFLLVLAAWASYALGPITGTMAICGGNSATLSNTTTGGTWTSSVSSVATISSTTGVYTGITAGTSTISYTDGVTTVTAVVTVNPLPGPITGTTSVCVGGYTTLSDVSAGGTWSSSTPSIAMVYSTGVVLGMSVGSTTISYSLATGCASTTIVSVTSTVAAITGPSSICVGSSGAFSDATTGGTWASSNVAILSIGASSGVGSGISAGVTTISYYLSTGCTATKTVTVNPLPSAISGAAAICPGSTLTLTDPTTGGVWTSSATSIVTISSSTGVLTGVSTGTATITYTSGATGCYATTVVTVSSSPSPITGAGSMCTGSTLSLADATPGGTWSSSSTGIATVGSTTGVVTSVAVGTTTISYSVASGCSTSTVVTVVAAPAAITGSSTVCLGSTTDLSDATGGGTWSSADVTIATVSSAGVVTGVGVGATTITYGMGTGCYTTAPITVSPAPSAITGSGSACVSGTMALADATPSGTWATSNPSIATIDAATGVVTGVSAGTASIYYVVSGCSVSTIVTVVTAPAAISGASTVCSGSTTLLTDPTTGGSWTSSSTGVATVSSAGGLVTGISAGTAIITYGLGTGCFSTHTITVNAGPAAISGPSPLCSGTTGTYTDVSAGGVWSATAPITISPASGVATATVTSPGSSVITYSLPTGCSATMIVSLMPAPAVTVSVVPTSCGGTYTGIAGGALTYTWAGTGLSCMGCSSPVITPSGTSTFTVTGVSSIGCSASATATITVDRINGHIAFGSGAPASPQCRVWLIQFNPADSSLLALDSALTCTDGAEEYYEFSSKPAGSYMVKAKLLSAVAGTSDYVPTYGVSAPFWSSATSVTHTASMVDTLHVDMLYGTVPTGPGFIAGLISAGAGKHTSGMAPAANIAVYLLNTSSNVLTYTTTDATGTYSFSGLANGSYLIYPEAFDYNTIPSAVITLTSSYENAVGINFWQRTSSHVITPYSLAVPTPTAAPAISIFPNPVTNNALSISWTNMQQGSAHVALTDAAGREWRSTTIEISGTNGTYALPVSELPSGVYFVTVTSANGTQTQKVSIAH